MAMRAQAGHQAAMRDARMPGGRPGNELLITEGPAHRKRHNDAANSSAALKRFVCHFRE